MYINYLLYSLKSFLWLIHSVIISIHQKCFKKWWICVVIHKKQVNFRKAVSRWNISYIISKKEFLYSRRYRTSLLYYKKEAQHPSINHVNMCKSCFWNSIILLLYDEMFCTNNCPTCLSVCVMKVFLFTIRSAIQLNLILSSNIL